MLSHVKKERKAQIEKNNKRSLSEFETVSVSARRGLFFCKKFCSLLDNRIPHRLRKRMLPFEDDNGGKLSYTLNGTLYPDEQVVIYDIGDVKPETEKKRRGRRKKSEIEAEQKEN